MKKIIFLLLLNFLTFEKLLADSFYFSNCEISNAVKGNYIINIKKNVIEVQLLAADGAVQNFSDEIKKIEKNKVVSEKIKSTKGDNIYYQYFLNSESNSVIKMEYKKSSGDDLSIFNVISKRQSFCSKVKTDWDKKKIDDEKISEEQRQVLKAQEQIKKEQDTSFKCLDDDYTKWENCSGVYKNALGNTYDGIYKNGKIIKGIAKFLGGAQYVGEFKDFKPDGFGTFIWSNGDKYFGPWINGKRNGNATMTWKDGRKYMGEFRNDQIEGMGTLFYPDGKKYVGGFLNGKRHGEGTFSYADGTSYVGKFLSGKEQGMGVCVGIDGSALPCQDKAVTQTQNFSGKNVRKITLSAKKWVRISQYETNTKRGKKIGDKLKADFAIKAKEICPSQDKYKILRSSVEIIDLDETPAYGLETKVLLGINGLVECL